MSGERRGYLDRSPGETRLVVTLDGRPERLRVVWADDPTPRLGARYAARVEAVSDRLGLARLDMGEAAGSLRLRDGAARVTVGERLEVEVLAEPHGDKPALVRRIGPGEGAPRQLAPPSAPQAEFAALGLDDWIEGDRARDMADAAQEEAVAAIHHLAGGVELAIESTRALTAVDVDFDDTAVASPLRANLRALAEAARLLRLKSVGGLIAIDLIGFPREAQRLHATAQEAFATDGPEVALASISRFGVLELSKPFRRQPAVDQLGEGDRLHPRAAAHAVVRALERQGRFDPGARLQARCSTTVAALARLWVAELGPRFSVQADPGLGAAAHDIIAL